MVNFINERRKLEELLKTPKNIKNDTYNNIILLVKHYKIDEHKSKKDIRNLIDDFMFKNYEGFIMADWDSIIQKIVNKYSKKDYSQFQTGKQINITYEELNFIKEKQDLETEQLLFVLLVLGKASLNESSKNIWVSNDSLYIFKLSKFKYCKKPRMMQREYKINDMATKGLLSPKAVCDSNDIMLNYGCMKKGEGINFVLDDETADNIVYNYLKWRGDNHIKTCEECGNLIYQNSKKPKKYCNKCAKKIMQIQKNEWKNKL